MRLRDLLDESVVKIGLESVDKEECFAELLDLLARSGRIPDRHLALAAVLKREATGTTGIGSGFAVPHAKDASIPSLRVAVGVSREGIEFDAVDDQPVHVVLLILANVDEPGQHVQALAEIVRLIKLPGFKASLLNAATGREVLDIIDAAE